ncbi:hypothetical protein D1007_16514 [Hordeum vulgare]|nr:hypothetical protein D1007_16514 [Hordeum vulgare]
MISLGESVNAPEAFPLKLRGPGVDSLFLYDGWGPPYPLPFLSLTCGPCPLLSLSSWRRSFLLATGNKGGAGPSTAWSAPATSGRGEATSGTRAMRLVRMDLPQVPRSSGTTAPRHGCKQRRRSSREPRPRLLW